MALLANIIWVIIGIIYIIYKFFREEFKFTSPQELRRTREDRIKEAEEKFSRDGYSHIDRDVIEELIDDPSSPLNSGHYKRSVPLSVCYKWMCRERTWQIDKLQDEEVSNQLGVPLNIIPIDKKLTPGEAYLRRTLLARNYLLLKKGLKYQAVTDTLQMRYRAKYLNESDEYYTFFNNFVDEYINKHQ